MNINYNIYLLDIIIKNEKWKVKTKILIIIFTDFNINYYLYNILPNIIYK